jgi:hypothetical protein
MINNFAIFLISFYLLIFCNFLPDILGCRLKTLLHTNIYIKHIIAYIILLFLIILTNEEFSNRHILELIPLSIIIYIWFIITTRTNIYIIIIILVLLLIIAYLDIKIKKETNELKIKDYKYYQIVLLVITIIISIIGFIDYFIYTYNEKMHKFNFNKFVFGSIKCDNLT